MDAALTTVYCLIGIVFLLLVIFLWYAIKIVPEYQRLVIFRLGRCIGEKGPPYPPDSLY